MGLMDEMQLNPGMRCAKYMLLVVSFMFAITAILLVMVGSTIQAIFGDFRLFVDDHFLSPPTFLIVIGFILLSVATLGAYGAIKESVMLINLYGLCLFLVFILEVSASLAAFVMQSQVKEMLMRTMNASLAQYDNYDYIKNGVDFMQSGLECCGVNSKDDWRLLHSDNVNLSKYVPNSCCTETALNNLKDWIMVDECPAVYENGCFNSMNFIISQSTMLIATGATTVAVVQLLGSICAFMLAKTLRHNKSLRAARRWQLQQSLGVLIPGGKTLPPTPANLQTVGYTQMQKTVNEKTIEFEPITYTPSSPSVN